MQFYLTYFKISFVEQYNDIDWSAETTYFTNFKNYILNNTNEEVVKNKTVINILEPLFNDCMNKKDFKTIVNENNIKNMKIAFEVVKIKCAIQAAQITMNKK